MVLTVHVQYSGKQCGGALSSMGGWGDSGAAGAASDVHSATSRIDPNGAGEDASRCVGARNAGDRHQLHRPPSAVHATHSANPQRMMASLRSGDIDMRNLAVETFARKHTYGAETSELSLY
jgi:hypothetical protein